MRRRKGQSHPRRPGPTPDHRVDDGPVTSHPAAPFPQGKSRRAVTTKAGRRSLLRKPAQPSLTPRSSATASAANPSQPPGRRRAWTDPADHHPPPDHPPLHEDGLRPTVHLLAARPVATDGQPRNFGPVPLWSPTQLKIIGLPTTVPGHRPRSGPFGGFVEDQGQALRSFRKLAGEEMSG